MSSSSSASSLDEDNLVQIIDVCEYYVSRDGEDAVQCAMVIGKKRDGTVVKRLVEDITHEFYLAVSEYFNEDQMRDLAHNLNEHLLRNRDWCTVRGTQACVCPPYHSSKPQDGRERNISTFACATKRATDACAVKSVELVLARSFHGYEPKPRPFVRFELTRSYYANETAAKFLQRAVQHDPLPARFKGVYEMAPLFKESFINTTRMAGFDWMDLNTKKRAEPQPAETEIVPLKYLDFDIETLHPTGQIKMETDSVGCIAALMEGPGVNRIVCFMLDQRPCNLFGLDKFKNDADLKPFHERGDIVLHHFDTEREMLEAFLRICVNEWDPDFLVGHNINGFDIPYIITRLRILGSPVWNDWSRLGPRYPLMKQTKPVYSKGKGTRDITTIHCPGRICLDTLRYCLEDTNLKLEDNSLGYLLGYFKLGAKDDMDVEDIYPSFHGSADDRGALMFYNVLDVIGTSKLRKHLMMATTTVINSKVFRVFPNDCLTRGISYNLVRMCTAFVNRQYLFPTLHYDKALDGKPTHPIFAENAYEMDLRVTGIDGGLVLEQKPIFINKPLAVLDFNSLYPSIIRAHNICHTTWIRDEEEMKRLGITEDMVEKLTNDSMYIKQEYLIGVYARIVTDLMDRRNAVRLEQERIGKSHPLYWVLESIQLAYKVAANSLYGQLGMKKSRLCHMTAGEAVTGKGRWYNTQVIDFLHNSEKLKQFNICVVYGDTDSTMFTFDNDSVEQARERFLIIQKCVNEESGIMKAPMKVGRDSLSLRVLFSGKKKAYALLTVNADPGAPIQPKLKIKGLQFVKRNTTKFVRDAGNKFLNLIMLEEKSREELWVYVRDLLRQLMGGKVPLKQLVLLQKLAMPVAHYFKDGTSDTSSHLHATAAQQLLDAGKVVETGDRIKYYLCDIGRRANTVAETVKAAALFDEEKDRLDLFAYGTRMVSAFSDICYIMFGPYADKLLDLTRYTVRGKWFESKMKGQEEEPIPDFSTLPPTVIERATISFKEEKPKSKTAQKKETVENQRKRSAGMMAKVFEMDPEKAAAPLAEKAKPDAAAVEAKKQKLEEDRKRSANFMSSFVQAGTKRPKAVQGGAAGFRLN